MTQNNQPEVVLITGASAGVGRATAREFARRGAKIGLVARGTAGLEGARRDVEDLGGQAIVLPADVAEPEQLQAAADSLEREFGPINVWINNAMCSVFSPVKEMTPAEFKRVTEVTYLGYVYGTLTAIKRMLPRDRGMIIQVGSALAYRGIPLQSAYCGAKHAIQGFTESLRCELIHDKSNVRISMVQMPALNTTQFGWVKSRLPNNPQPVPPIYQPEVAANAIFHAAHHYRREWFVGFPTVIAIQGNKLAPGLGDKYLGSQGYSSQQTEGLVDPNRPNNLEQPVDQDQDYGAHGTFDQRAHSRSWQLIVDQNRELIGLAAIAGGVLGAMSHGAKKNFRTGLFTAILAAAGALGGIIKLKRGDLPSEWWW